jgi:SRSO17 transposase
VRRKVIAGTVVALAAVAIGAVAIGSREGTSPGQQVPLRAKPSQRFGDDADLMRRLERKKLTTTTTQ